MMLIEHFKSLLAKKNYVCNSMTIMKYLTDLETDEHTMRPVHFIDLDKGKYFYAEVFHEKELCIKLTEEFNGYNAVILTGSEAGTPLRLMNYVLVEV